MVVGNLAGFPDGAAVGGVLQGNGAAPGYVDGSCGIFRLHVVEVSGVAVLLAWGYQAVAVLADIFSADTEGHGHMAVLYPGTVGQWLVNGHVEGYLEWVLPFPIGNVDAGFIFQGYLEG